MSDNLVYVSEKSYKSITDDFRDLNKYSKTHIYHAGDVSSWQMVNMGYSSGYKPSYCGCYIWIENIHNKNKYLYVGQSKNIRARLYSHYVSWVDKYFDEVIQSPNSYCSNYEKSCDCIPRVIAITIETNKYIELEKILINQLNPELNRRLYEIGNIEGME